MSIEEAYKKLLSQLSEVYEKREASNISNLVIEKITGKGKTERMVDKTSVLSSPQLEAITRFTQELLLHKPLQYVLNETWFYGLSYFVDENVLIPRPETEELVQWLIDSEQNKKQPTASILEVGTGSGCIAISLQKNIKDASIIAIDISNEALEVAKKNASKNKASIHFIKTDFLDEFQWSLLPKFDFIISNPPYIMASEASNMQKNVLDFEPHIALFVPDNDALLFYRKIALFGKKHLYNNGEIFVEINERLGNEVAALFINENYQVELKKDLQGKDRMLKATFSK